MTKISFYKLKRTKRKKTSVNELKKNRIKEGIINWKTASFEGKKKNR